jgi:hypothetical protein
MFVIVEAAGSTDKTTVITRAEVTAGTDTSWAGPGDVLLRPTHCTELPEEQVGAATNRWAVGTWLFGAVETLY